MVKHCDYIVVGGGSTGCVIAGRLSEDPAVSVTLLEEGPRDSSPYIRFPGTYYKTAQGKLLKRLPWESGQEGKAGAHGTMVQASVLGGGSSVNAMIYIRGNPQDYDGWAAAGAEGWSYREVLPYFMRSEDNEKFSNAVHATGGPLGVSDPGYIHPLTRRWLQACQESGFDYRSDFNAGEQAGCGIYQLTTRKGLRSSAASAFLRPARSRSNLQVLTGRQVTRLLIEQGRAVGVEYLERGRLVQLRAGREVILSAGAIASPKLLMLSGIGPAAPLERLGIGVQADLPGVGQNLQDHCEMSLIYQLKGPDSYDKYKSLRWKPWALMQYLVGRSGPISTNLIEGGAFSRGTASDPIPDLQYFFVVGAGIEEGVDAVPGGNGCTVNFGQLRPRSRGSVSLRSASPADAPFIRPNYLAEAYDRDCLVEGFLKVQEIMRQPSIRALIEAPYFPKQELSDRQEITRFLQDTVHAALHPVGTCRMGRDANSVVDPSLRLHGIEGLRVADASIMPAIISGNTNAPCIMIGEKAADLIRNGAPHRASSPARAPQEAPCLA